MQEMTEEEEIRLREEWRKWNQLQAEIAVENEARLVPAIGYGTLYDDCDGDDDDYHDFTLSLDVLLPEEADFDSVSRLRDMVETTVKQWLMDFAPRGTLTDLVAAVYD